MKNILTNYKFITFATAAGLLVLLFLSRFENLILPGLILAYQLFLPLYVSGQAQKTQIQIFNLKTLKFDLTRVLLFSLILFPPFIFGFYLIFDFKNFSFPPNFLILILTQIFLIALPEEFFYRGFLQSRFLAIFENTKHKIYFVFISTNLIFALAHFVLAFNPARLLTFFPGLIFSYLAYKSQNLLGSIVFHAMCNILGQILVLSIL